VPDLDSLRTIGELDREPDFEPARAMQKEMKVQIDALPQGSRWSLRDWIAAAGLFLATAAVVLWQDAHLVVLWDLSYTLDSSVRFALGQTPYRDFPFVHPPLTFLIQAAIVRLAGRVYWHHVLYAAVVGGLGTVLAWRIALRSLRGRVAAEWPVSVLLAAPLTVLGIYSILPLPSYDCDSAFSILVAILLLQRLAPDAPTTSAMAAPKAGIRALLLPFATGGAVALPLFFKQNIGLPLLAVTAVVILLMLGVRLIDRQPNPPASPGIPALLALLAGAAATLLAAALLLQCTVGLGNYIHWTIQFAMERRLPGFKDMLGIYLEPSLLWTLPCVAVALLLLRSRLAQQDAEDGRIASQFPEKCTSGAKAPVDIAGSAARLKSCPDTRRSSSAARKTRWARLLALALLAAPFLFTLFALFLSGDADDRAVSLLALWPLLLILAAALTLFYLLRGPLDRALVPAALLAAIHGTLLSQQLWGSTYAIWPLLILLVAEMIAFLASVTPSRKAPETASWSPAPALAAVIASTLLVCGGLYTASEDRLSFIDLPDGPLVHSTVPQLMGMATPGPYLPDFEELLRFAAGNIPASDGLILLPGEDPFYFATGRVPQFPVLLFDPATDPYSPAQIVELVRARNIRWLIVKRELQIKEDVTPQREATMKALLGDFKPYARLTAYDVYRR
jgi:hypothetical protein